ncbi:MAG: Ltp family lipoprotein [Candidatus Nanopelagicales bacterium]
MTNDPNLHWDGTRWLRWNGTEWVDASTAVAPATYAAPVDPSESHPETSVTKKPWFWPVVAVGGVLVVGFFALVGLAAVGGGMTASPSTSVTAAAPTSSAPLVEPTPEPPPPAVPEPAAPAAPEMTVSQENAVDKAESYLGVGAFSKSGLVKQLKFEGFSTADANFAVANIQVDWNEQAAKKAQAYMDISSFSKSGLIKQLKFEGFTAAQAAYGAKSVGL